MRVLLRCLDLPLDTEPALRQAAYDLCGQLHDQYGLSYEKIDGYLWLLGREVCYKENPDCTKCPLAIKCAKKTQKTEPRIHTFWY
jgi:adenine-specific DNA glycosylase